MTVASELPARPLTLDDVTLLAASDSRHRFELTEGNGRIPDLVVTTGPVADDIVWLAPEMVALAVEIVSKGSERTDRWLKPVEYAEAGIARFWRVEPDDTVVQFRLDGKRYIEYGSVALDELLGGDTPELP